MTNLNTTKEQERSELHRAIWQIANDLRGSVDGWDFKQYVLGILFYRFISENLTNYINEDERRVPGQEKFDYVNLSDKEAEFGRKETIINKGFYILPSELFVNVRNNARNDANLNETLTAVFRNIEIWKKTQTNQFINRIKICRGKAKEPASPVHAFNNLPADLIVSP